MQDRRHDEWQRPHSRTAHNGHHTLPHHRYDSAYDDRKRRRLSPPPTPYRDVAFGSRHSRDVRRRDWERDRDRDRERKGYDRDRRGYEDRDREREGQRERDRDDQVDERRRGRDEGWGKDTRHRSSDRGGNEASDGSYDTERGYSSRRRSERDYDYDYDDDYERRQSGSTGYSRSYSHRRSNSHSRTNSYSKSNSKSHEKEGDLDRLRDRVRQSRKLRHEPTSDALSSGSTTEMPPPAPTPSRPSQSTYTLKERPTEPRNHRNSAPNSPAPSIPAQHPTLSLNPEYISASLGRPSTLRDPTEVRKLLVLDLNGTLLFRAPYKPLASAPFGSSSRGAGWRGRPGRGHPTRPSNASTDTASPSKPPSAPASNSNASSTNPAFDPAHPYANPYAPRPLRWVHARPYLPALRAYLAHPETRAWLDAAVWSSAQPHSVRDMVGRVFTGASGDGEDNDGDPYAEATKHLLAVWARDTLGLTVEAYHQKTQTTKDLVRLWDALARSARDGKPPVPLPVPPSASLPSKPESKHKPTLDADADAESRSDSTSDSTAGPIDSFDAERPGSHQANELLAPHGHDSTLLLDDSPLKARLQPWNHLCVPEYDARSHAAVRAWAARREAQPGDHEAAKGVGGLEGEVQATAEVIGGDGKNEHGGTKEQERDDDDDDLAPDAILLAVIGILDAARVQRSVVAWIRGGGLWARGSVCKPSRESDDVGKRSGSGSGDGERAEPTAPDSKPTPTTTTKHEDDPAAWCADRANVVCWARRGERALAALGIPVVCLED